MSRPDTAPAAPSDAATAAPTPPETEPKRPNRRLIVIGAVVLVAAVAGGRWWWEALHHVTTDNATVVGHIHPVSGRLAGTVSEVLVTDNQLVKKGDVLVLLDPTDAELRVAQAKSALEAARKAANTAASSILVTQENAAAQSTLATGNVDAATAALAAARSAAIQADANLDKARRDYERYASLVEAGGISRQQFDAARTALTAAEAIAKAARQDVQRAAAQATGSRSGLQQAAATRQQTDVSRNQHAAALAAVEQAEVALKDAQTQLSYTRIVASSDGRIGKRSVEVGQRIQPGQALMAIVSSETWVVANLKETQLEQVKPGEPVAVHLDAYPDHPLKGRVDSISPASGAQFALLPPDNATGNFTKIVQRVPVKIVWEPDSADELKDRLVPGLSAQISIDISGK